MRDFKLSVSQASVVARLDIVEIVNLAAPGHTAGHTASHRETCKENDENEEREQSLPAAFRYSRLDPYKGV